MKCNVKTQNHSNRVPMWLPYLHSIRETKKGIFEFVFNGGTEIVNLNEISSIMIYGETDTKLDQKILDKITRKGIPIIIHRRNMSQPIYITGGLRPDKDDTITEQLVKRQQSRTSTHIARQLLIAKMHSMSYLIPSAKVPQFANIKTLRNIEATHAHKYWRAYFTKLNHPEWIRRDKNPASEALDGASKFISGIILRWITYHHLSPYHGFLHEPTDYPSLVYDLMEPTRGIFESILLQVFINTNQKDWLVNSISELKMALDEQIYTSLTRQIVTRQELLHGTVLSLKYYLLGRQRKFLIPLPGSPNGGRPPKVEFLLYGRHAGKTNFWEKAEIAANNDKWLKQKPRHFDHDHPF
ncbi:MAG: CRISPR-associated endonuclease Cas1 [Candidatus Nomurabacteria bacterium]|jgi:CRISPR/Cas system-associated endonuclease Cas1|nr:CRISPR-associated endonuclease Cas1 [Candidatus Nomurabacteria bacterium]